MIKKKLFNKFLIRLLFAFIIASFTIAIIGCSSNNSATDIVTITGVNRYYTDADSVRGMKTLETTIHVKMSHNRHEKSGIKCVTCHHKLNNDERIKKCAYCHKGLAGARLFHTFCAKCHKDKNEGPVRCNECHIEKQEKQSYKDIENMYGKTFVFDKKSHKAHEDAAVKCNVCHHDAGEETNKKKCDTCHVGKSKMVILHYFCKDCHKQKGGPVKCQECHAGVKSEYQNVKDIIPLDKTGHRLPQIQFNHRGHVEEYNTECINCHHMGSTGKCSSCHKKKDEGSVVNLKAAFHQQCHECHRRTAGPQDCHSCHRERK